MFITWISLLWEGQYNHDIVGTSYFGYLFFYMARHKMALAYALLHCFISFFNVNKFDFCDQGQSESVNAMAGCFKY